MLDRNKIIIIDGAGTHVTDKFNINVTGQKLTITAKNLNDSSFYNHTYVVIITTKVKDTSKLRIDVNNNYYALNKATVTIDNQSKETIQVHTEVVTHEIETEVVKGEIDPNTIVFDGQNVTINYNPVLDYALKSIEVDGEYISLKGNENSYTFKNVTSDHRIRVVYDSKYTISTEVVNGTIDPSKSVLRGENVTINYSPKNGSELVEIIVDGEQVDIEEFKDNYTFENITGNHTIKVVYLSNPKTGAANIFGIFTLAILLCALVAYVIYKKPVMKA